MARFTWIVWSLIGVGVAVPLLTFFPWPARSKAQETQAPTTPLILCPTMTPKSKTRNPNDPPPELPTLPSQTEQTNFFPCQDLPTPPPTSPPAPRPSMKTVHEKLDEIEQKLQQQLKATTAAYQEPAPPPGPEPLPTPKKEDATPLQFGSPPTVGDQPPPSPAQFVPVPSPFLKAAPTDPPVTVNDPPTAPVPPPAIGPAPTAPAPSPFQDPSLRRSSGADVPPPLDSIVRSQPAKPLSSPWTFNLEVVDGKNVVTAKVGKAVQFRVLCDKVDIQSPGGNIQAQGHVLISCQALEANGERMTIQLQSEFIVLEGNAQVKYQGENQVMEFVSDRFSMRLSELQAHGASSVAPRPNIPPIVDAAGTEKRD